MASQLEWDEFEAALLLDAAEYVLKNPSAKKQTVEILSNTLRKRAINRGINIDNVFRNTNGIFLQMTKAIYLITNGEIGLPGASKIFVDMAAVKKNNPSEFAHFLNLARQQVANDKSEKLNSTKETLIFRLNNKHSEKYSSPAISRQGKSISLIHDLENNVNTATMLSSTQENILMNSSYKMDDETTLEDKLYVELKKECEKNQYGATLDYLIRQVDAPEKDVKAILSQVEWASLKYGKYSISNEDNNEYHTYDFQKNPSLSFTKPVKALYFDELISRASTWRQLYLDFLRVLYDDYPHIINGIIGKIFPHFSSPLVGNATHISQFRKPREFAPELYVETNISAHDTVANLKKFLDLCNVDYENIKIIYERKSTKDATVKTVSSASNITYSRMLNSLNETLEYLRTRYNVRMVFNHFDDPKSHSNDMLYKANNGNKDIIWVYFIIIF